MISQPIDITTGDWTVQRANELSLECYIRFMRDICDFLEDKYYKQAMTPEFMMPVWERTIYMYNHLTYAAELCDSPSLQHLGLSKYSNTLDDIINKIHAAQNDIPHTPQPINKVLKSPTFLWFWNSKERQFWTDIINLMIHASTARILSDMLLPELTKMINRG